MVEDKRPYYGRDRRESRERRASRPADNRRVQSLLPHPSIMEQYEDIAPGSSGRIIHLAEEELLHRHDWEDQYLYEYMRLYRIGQGFGFVLSLITVGLTFYLVLEKEYVGASLITLGGFGALVAASIASSVKRRFEGKKRYRRQEEK